MSCTHAELISSANKQAKTIHPADEIMPASRNELWDSVILIRIVLIKQAFENLWKIKCNRVAVE